MMNWQPLNYFGDTLLLCTCAVIVTLLLLIHSSNRAAMWQWLLFFCTLGAIVCLSKLAFMGWEIGSYRYDFTCFSGHAALSSSLWPVLLWLLCGRCPRWIRLSAIAAGYLIACMVGVSSVVTHAHSLSEVIGGLLLGSAASASFLLLQRSRTLPLFSPPQLVTALILPVILIVNHKTASTQTLLKHTAMALSQRDKPFTRGELHRLNVSAPLNHNEG